MSERAYSTDTRFWLASEFREKVEEICGRKIIHSVADAEPLGPKSPLDALIIAPCTGNTLAKLSHGITDSAVTMAAKAHLRQDRPLLIALSTNDAMSQNLSNIACMLTRKSVYFVPMRQDDPKKKPHSLVADLTLLPDALVAMKDGAQLRPLFLPPK
jgi:dipicolinate synthase subunit B